VDRLPQPTQAYVNPEANTSFELMPMIYNRPIAFVVSWTFFILIRIFEPA